MGVPLTRHDEQIPWLSTDSRFAAGVEIGSAAALMVLGLSFDAPFFAQCEEQLRALAGHWHYQMQVTRRTPETIWISMTKRATAFDTPIGCEDCE